MKGGGPIGEILYEVGETKIGSQMGKLMVNEMVSSWSCGGTGKKEHNHKAMIWESMWESQQNEKKEYVVELQHDNRLTGLPSLKGNEEQHECQKYKEVL